MMYDPSESESIRRWVLTLCAVALTAVAILIALLDVRPMVQNWGALPGEVHELRAAVQTIPGEVAAQVVAGLQPEIRHGVDRLMDEVHGARKDLTGQIEAARLEVLGPDGRFVALQGAVMGQVSELIRIIDATRSEGIQPVLSAASGLISTYQELPDRIGAEIQPAWRSLQPEITCRQLDGSGYGGCWHSRITALMGEAARVGGVFTQRFPAMADAFTSGAQSGAGILAIGQRAAAKYIDPRPMKTGDYFKAAGKITFGLGTAALRGGVF